MEFLGIGPLELLFIVVIIIVVIGPKDIQRTMRTLGRMLNNLYKSDGWKAFNEASRQLRSLPNKLAEEAELEEVRKTAQELGQQIGSAAPNLSAWAGPKETKPAAPAAAVAPSAAAAPAKSQPAAKPAPSPRLSSKQPLPGAEVPAPVDEPAPPVNGDAKPLTPEASTEASATPSTESGPESTDSPNGTPGTAAS